MGVHEKVVFPVLKLQARPPALSRLVGKKKRNVTASVDRLLVKKRTFRISGIFATFSRYPEGFSWALVVIMVNPLSNQRDNENGYTEIFHF